MFRGLKISLSIGITVTSSAWSGYQALSMRIGFDVCGGGPWTIPPCKYIVKNSGTVSISIVGKNHLHTKITDIRSYHCHPNLPLYESQKNYECMNYSLMPYAMALLTIHGFNVMKKRPVKPLQAGAPFHIPAQWDPSLPCDTGAPPPTSKKKSSSHNGEKTKRPQKTSKYNQ